MQAATAVQATVRDKVDPCDKILPPSRKELRISDMTTGITGGGDGFQLR